MKKKNRIVSIFLMLLMVTYTQAQNDPTIEWQNTIGGSDTDFLTSVSQTADGGYIVGGYSKSNISGDKTENTIGPDGEEDLWILKLDSFGDIEWQKTIGENGMDFLTSVAQTSDGGYIVGGYLYPNATGNITADYWVIKLNSVGTVQWQNKIGGNNEDVLKDITQTTDGGYILGGYSWSNATGDKTENSNGDYDYWVVKLNNSGSIEWQNTIGGFGRDQLNAIEQTSDGGYILGGWSRSNISGDKSENIIGNSGLEDYWIVKLNVSGSIQWQNTIGGDKADVLRDIAQTADGGYVLAGHSKSDSSGDKTEDNHSLSDDFWVVKLDSSGDIKWQNTIGGSLTDLLISVEQTSDGGYILGGQSTSGATGDKTEDTLSRDFWIVKVDASGIIEWQNTIGGNKAEVFGSISQTIDDGFILGGWSHSDISKDKTENSIGADDYWIVKLKESTLSIPENDLGNDFAVYPNPSEGKITIDLGKNYHQINLRLFSVGGQTILDKTIYDSERMDLELDIAQGLYFISLQIPGGNSSFHKIIVY